MICLIIRLYEIVFLDRSSSQANTLGGHNMKKIYLIVGLISSLSGFASAQRDNHCTYGGSVDGAVRLGFTKIQALPFPFTLRYEAKLSENLSVTVTRAQGHSARYSMVVNYNNGLVQIDNVL